MKVPAVPAGSCNLSLGDCLGPRLQDPVKVIGLLRRLLHLGQDQLEEDQEVDIHIRSMLETMDTLRYRLVRLEGQALWDHLDLSVGKETRTGWKSEFIDEQ